jgi:DNA adenine methylase
MALSAFPYVGGKTRLVDWVTDHLPNHTTYVEPFGGSAAVLLNKPRSAIEVYNDLDRDIVQFFEIARDRPDELVEWVRRTPFSEELHAEYVQDFYNGERPEEPIARAGRFLFLRYSQFGGKYDHPSGFKRDTIATLSSEASAWANVAERIEATCERLQGVSIQHDSFEALIERYDSPSTVFYCDPPYLDKESTYRVDGFAHGDLAAALHDIEGYALVSYTDRPEGLYPDWDEVTREYTHDSGKDDGRTKAVTERLLCNFDPEYAPTFVDASQQTLTEVSPDA